MLRHVECSIILILSVQALDMKVKVNVENESMADCLKNVAENYFSDSSGTTFVGVSSTGFFVPDMKALTIRTTKNFMKANFLESSVIIMANEKFSEDMLNDFSRSFRTKFIIVTEEENVGDVLRTFWKWRILYVILLVPKVNFIDILTYDPFNARNCSDFASPISLNKWDIGSRKFQSPWRSLTNAKVNFLKCSLNVSFMDYPPFAIKDPTKSEWTEMGGIEGNIITIMANKLNFTTKYINRHESEWGGFEPVPTGLVGDLYTGQSDIGFGILYPFTIRYAKLDGAINYNLQDHSAWIVPKSAGSKMPHWLESVVLEFTPLTWLFIILTIFISWLFLKVVNRLHSEEYLNWTLSYLLSYLFNQHPAENKIASLQPFILSWMWFTFIITSAYQSSMSSRITAPSPPPDITNLEQLARSKFIIATPDLGLFAVKAAAENDKTGTLKVIRKKMKASNITLNDVLVRIAKKRDLGYFQHKAIMQYVEAVNREVTGKVHIVDEGIFPQYPVILFKKHSFLTEYGNGIIGKLNDVGMVEKWKREFFPTLKHAGAIGPRSLALRDIYAAVILILSGLGLSLVCFGLEIFFWKLNGNRVKVTRCCR